MIRAALAAFVLSCAFASPAGAHDTFLWPSTFTPAQGEAVTFELGSATRFPDMENRIAVARVDHYSIAPGLLDEVSPEAPAFAPTAHPAGPGAARIEVQLLPRDIDLEPEEAAHYFSEIGASQALRDAYEAQGGGVLRETYTKTIAAILCVETCETAQDAFGGTPGRFRFLPVARDGFAPLHVFQLVFLGEPVANQQVLLSTTNAGVFILRTDEDGIIFVPHDAHGPLLLSSTILRPPAEPGARWTSDFATLTFWRP